MGDETVDALGQLWLARAARCARLAIPALERWLARQLQHLPVGRPYGSRIFARVREAALFGGDVTLAARVDALADRVRPMLESRPDELIASLVCGPRVLMSRGHSSDGTRQ
jgi:hypothetical protein